ncbi:MAG: M42 family metallopeptidase [Spirochaetaceae bacterium]
MEEEIIRSQRELSELIGCPGREKPVREYLKTRLRDAADELGEDGAGNLFAVVRGSDESSARKVLLTAHMDEVGFMVSHIEESGFLRVASLGAIDTLLLSGTPVQFVGTAGKKLYGVFTSIPPHVRKNGEKSAVPALEELSVDIGLSTREEVELHGLSVGSVGTFLSPFRELEGGALMGKAFDDRSGCNIALQTALRWSEGSPEDKPQNTLICLFTSAEEHNHLGARSAALSHEADVVIALENTTTTDIPGVAPHQVVTCLGKGPALTVADKSYIVPEHLLEFIQQTARTHGIPWQYKKPVYGSTDAGSLYVLGGGTPAALVSVPCRYIHAPSGITLASDLRDSAELVYQVCREYR